MATSELGRVEHRGTYAKVIADSISHRGHRLTTMEVRFHRFVLAEFNTHRVFSRNSASSRAIPVSKNLDKVYFDPAAPVEWRIEQRGMQGGEVLGYEDQQAADLAWEMAARKATVYAEDLADIGVHKSIVNRLLEPFMYHTVIVSSTTWDNFFLQRCSPLAQPEIRVAAELMEQMYRASKPRELAEGEWHLPYIRDEHGDWEEQWDEGDYTEEDLKHVSVARCARVSYLTHDGKRDIGKDLDLYDRLVSADPPHWSPLEHVATPDSWNDQALDISAGRKSKTIRRPKVGNFLGWRQHRFDVEIEKEVETYA